MWSVYIFHFYALVTFPENWRLVTKYFFHIGSDQVSFNNVIVLLTMQKSSQVNHFRAKKVSSSLFCRYVCRLAFLFLVRSRKCEALHATPGAAFAGTYAIRFNLMHHWAAFIPKCITRLVKSQPVSAWCQFHSTRAKRHKFPDLNTIKYKRCLFLTFFFFP